MKFADLRSTGHNIADSLASGVALMIGIYTTDIYREAATSPEGYIEVDFLLGTSAGGTPSASLAGAINLYAQALEGLCRRHGVERAAFRVLTARYEAGPVGVSFTVSIEDCNGRCVQDKYVDSPKRRVRTVDTRGRVRTLRPGASG
jgi:hypothetical protein